MRQGVRLLVGLALVLSIVHQGLDVTHSQVRLIYAKQPGNYNITTSNDSSTPTNTPQVTTPTPQPSPTPTPQPSPSPSPSPSPTPTPQPSPTPTPTPQPTPTPSPTPSPTPQPSPTPSPTPSPQPSPTPTPKPLTITGVQDGEVVEADELVVNVSGSGLYELVLDGVTQNINSDTMMVLQNDGLSHTITVKNSYGNSKQITFKFNKMYWVKFIGFNGVELKSYKVKQGDSVKPPEVPTIEGYTFSGWDKSYENINSNLDIKAIYTENLYNLTFKVGDKTYETYVLKTGQQLRFPNNPTKEGYTFLNWGEEIPEKMPQKDLTLTAVWKPNVYEIYLTQSVGVELDVSLQHKVDSTVEVLKAEQYGYTLKGLYYIIAGDATRTEHNLDINFTEDGKVTFKMPPHDISLYARVEKNEALLSPTDTPSPTSTPEPTTSPSPVPTSTPNPTNTPVVDNTDNQSGISIQSILIITVASISILLLLTLTIVIKVKSKNSLNSDEFSSDDYEDTYEDSDDSIEFKE